MYKIKRALENYQINFPLEQYAPLDKILFLDIETTGLSASNSQLYMIGLAYYEGDSWYIEQRMTQRRTEERDLLIWLSDVLPHYTHIIHFNGNRFDIPYLLEKAGEHFISLSFDAYEGIDIYKRIHPFKDFLVLPNCRQKTIEQFLGINRVDKYTGGELIQIYKAYEASQNESMLELLLQHNFDDMKGMLDITPVLAYSDLCNTAVQVTRVEMQKNKTVDGHNDYELLMTLKFPTAIPKKIFAHYDGNYITVTGNKALLKVPIFQTELKFFYSNYKDYYYIPLMDAAYHKSVSAELDASLRVQASAANCYTQKSGMFLKQYDVLVEPFFKADYKDTVTFFEITEETKQNRDLFSNYCSHILKTIIS